MRSNFPKPASGCNPTIRGGQIIKVTLISRNFLVKRQMLAGVADTNERTRETEISQTRCKEFFISRSLILYDAFSWLSKDLLLYWRWWICVRVFVWACVCKSACIAWEFGPQLFPASACTSSCALEHIHFCSWAACIVCVCFRVYAWSLFPCSIFSLINWFLPQFSCSDSSAKAEVH